MPLTECEFATAGPATPIHLRHTTTIALSGAIIHTLCGRNGNGWDITETTPKAALAAHAREKETTVLQHMCHTCIAALDTTTEATA